MKKKKNPDGILEMIAVIQNDIQWIKEELVHMKRKIDKIDSRFWRLMWIFLGILCTLLAAVLKF